MNLKGEIEKKGKHEATLTLQTESNCSILLDISRFSTGQGSERAPPWSASTEAK